ncbi:unnamed protein product [Vitrella brassicaformis CCMP3155]|uniref:Ubiquitin-like domain-containing protein n=3 Tax=Vitrella brassicaformis TaxID=1169539 RepID=A0A0G4GJD6_VITBC|nr:unnamed protein product [Vitrella brassicaformis CCMP3155]|eukprot:CEM29981.1 unnamed protein product [Vitrella brassicaformis CCMP3155]
MFSLSAGSASAAGGGHSNVFGHDDSRSPTSEEQSRFVDLFGRLLHLHEQMAASHSQAGEAIRYLAGKGSVAAGSLPMLEGAVVGMSDALDHLQAELKRVDGVALLEGHARSFELVAPDAEAADADDEDATQATETKKKDEGTLAFRFVRQLHGLPEPLMHQALLPFVAEWSRCSVSANQGPHTALAKISSRLCCTSPAVGSTVAAALVPHIDALMVPVAGVMGYRPLRRSRDVRRPHWLVRLHYVLVTGGDWKGNEGLLRLAQHHGRLTALRIQLRADDLQRIGTKAVVDRRPPSVRQFTLYGHRLGEDLQLTRMWFSVGLSAWPERFRVRADAGDPGCEEVGRGTEYSSFRSMIIERLAPQRLRLVSCRSWQPLSAEYDRISALIHQPTPSLWGCRTVDFASYGRPCRLVALCGDKEGDACPVYIKMTRFEGHLARISLYTTEVPQGDGCGAAGCPVTAACVRDKVDDEAIATAVLSDEGWLGPTFSIFFRVSEERTVTVDVTLSDTVEDIAAKMRHQEDIPVDPWLQHRKYTGVYIQVGEERHGGGWDEIFDKKATMWDISIEKDSTIGFDTSGYRLSGEDAPIHTEKERRRIRRITTKFTTSVPPIVWP